MLQRCIQSQLEMVMDDYSLYIKIIHRKRWLRPEEKDIQILPSPLRYVRIGRTDPSLIIMMERQLWHSEPQNRLLIPTNYS